MRAAGAALALSAAISLTPCAHAHQPSESYLRIRPAEQGATFDVRWDVALLDLEQAIGLDGDGDGAITWGEVKARGDAIADYALAHLAVSAGGESCVAAVSRTRVDEHADGPYAVLDVAADCRGRTPMRVRYDLLFDVDPTHRGLVVYESGAGPIAGVFSSEQRIFSVAGQAPSGAATFMRFVGEGVHHLAIGYDHIAFLVLLLLPAGLGRREAERPDTVGAGAVVLDVLKVVTAFTLAHSLTLGLAAAGVLTLSPSFAEPAIAASIMAAALFNLLPSLRGRRWWVAFGFGLVHGFGFATVLGELELHGAALAAPLAGFNVGVELGQLLIAAAALPLVLLLRGRPVYRRWIVPGGSIAISALAGYWLVERL